jgi:hypothetical protein
VVVDDQDAVVGGGLCNIRDDVAAWGCKVGEGAGSWCCPRPCFEAMRLSILTTISSLDRKQKGFSVVDKVVKYPIKAAASDSGLR